MATKKNASSPPAALRRWKALTPAQQLAAVREVCGSQGQSLLKQFDGAIAVGAGFKKSANQVTEDICLGILVVKKRRGRMARPVPAHVVVTLVREGKRIRLSIPTDVEELGRGQPHAVNIAQGIRAFDRNDASQGIGGAACCIVADANQPANRFVLGCRHVLALSLLTTGCAAFNETDVADAGMTTRIGQLYFPLPMAPDGTPCLDGAIALLDSSIPVDWQSQGIRPTSVEPGVRQPLNCFVFTPAGPLQATFVKEWANVPLPYANCGTVTIAAAYQFQAATVAGHSGSPVMSSDGTLFGMHFWGDPDQQLAMSIPAFMLFQRGRFPVTIQLA